MVLTKIYELEEFYKLLRLDASYNSYQNIINFESNVSKSTFDTMTISLNSFIDNLKTKYPNFTNPRILVSDPDGTVAYDSNNWMSKRDPNAYTLYTSKLINENHNSRTSIMTALISNAGIGKEQKWSSSAKVYLQYLAVRIGLDSENSYGVIRVSLQ